MNWQAFILRTSLTWLALGLAPAAPGLLAAAALPEEAALRAWQGEWGAWTIDRAGVQRGASVSISDCAGGTCRAKIDIEGERASCSALPDPGLELEVLDATHARAVFVDYDDQPKDCRLTLQRLGESTDRRLDGRLEGRGCDYFCSGEVVQPGPLPWRSDVTFPESSRRACFADKRTAARLWCTDPELRRIDKQLTAAATIAGHSDPDALIRRLETQREAIFNECEGATDRLSCLRLRLEAAHAEWIEAQTAAEKTAQARAAAIEAPGDGSRAAAVLSAIDGVYKKRFANALVDGSKYESEDILELVRLDGADGADDAAVYFRAHLEFYNGHSCDVSGKATYRSTGAFVFEEDSEAFTDGPCQLLIEATELEVRLADPDGRCRAFYCGARGALDGAAFPRSARRTIRYLDRLKASEEYKRAIGADEEP